MIYSSVKEIVSEQTVAGEEYGFFNVAVPQLEEKKMWYEYLRTNSPYFSSLATF